MRTKHLIASMLLIAFTGISWWTIEVLKLANSNADAIRYSTDYLEFRRLYESGENDLGIVGHLAYYLPPTNQTKKTFAGSSVSTSP